MKRIALLVAIFALLAVTAVNAQPTQKPLSWQVFGGYTPVAGKADDGLEAGWGLGFGVTWRPNPGKLPLGLRFDTSYDWWDAKNVVTQDFRVAVEIGAGGLFDETAVYGDDLVYAVATLRETPAATTDVPVFSEPRYAGPVAFRDIFPPLPPSDLDAVPQTGSVRVFWFPGGSRDEARARVEREIEGGDGFQPLATVEAPESHVEDRDVEPGRRYRCRVTVEDREGNVAETVGPTGWVSPRPAEVPGT